MGAYCSSSKKAVTPSREFIPGYQFQGDVVFRDFSTKEDYDEHKYQYATTSYAPELMQPAIIAYAANENDIIQVIKFAADKNIAVSIRTGGHSYCGSSSTSGPNIQLDVSRAFASEADFKYFEVENGSPRVRAGI
eukprot:gene63404-86727_t